MKKYYVYILTNFTKTVLYIGFTGDLEQRVVQHKAAEVPGFTKKYKTNILVYYEEFKDINEAKGREKALKKWKRGWKEKLINESNPDWKEVMVL